MEVGKGFEKLVDIMAQLRSPDGCPWDREQTHQSLRQYLLEETYEVLETIDNENWSALKDELGDMLLQVVFHAQIASERDEFAMTDILQSITEKLIRRHPNVFGDVQISSAQEQSVNWERIKKKEGKESVLDGVPRALAALLRASRVQQKASTVGFDWPEPAPVWDKIDEEIRELKAALEAQHPAGIEEEFGDLLFSLVNLARFINVNPEAALRSTVDKFERRFRTIEMEFQNSGKQMQDLTLEELDKQWERAKRQEQQRQTDSKK